ncbi:MAG: hypothetical protein EA403_03940 [Spirochaetaceae bacterium]|nr:MAG: hypothetical protein EA403_03940 [Spirochaetaceae bacterium]
MQTVAERVAINRIEQDWELFILIGHTGSGRTEAVRALEDMGIPGVDNLPPQLLVSFAEIRRNACRNGSEQSCAVALDCSAGVCGQDAVSACAEIAEAGIPFRVIALEATDSVAVGRIAERRGEPGSERIAKQLARERTALEPLFAQACEVLDTSHLSIPDLRERMGLIIKGVSIHRHIAIDIHSFGFKYGPFVPADIVFDVRFIANPYYVAELRELTGMDEPCARYVMEQPNSEFFVEHLTDLLTTLGPSYSRVGKARLRVGIGCTGGQHRSVAVTERLVREIHARGMHATAHHREIGSLSGERT